MAKQKGLRVADPKAQSASMQRNATSATCPHIRDDGYDCDALASGKLVTSPRHNTAMQAELLSQANQNVLT